MSNDLATDDQVVDVDRDVEDLSLKMPAMKMKRLMSCCGEVMSLMHAGPLGSSGLCYHVKINDLWVHSGFVWMDFFVPRFPLKSSRMSRLVVGDPRPDQVWLSFLDASMSSCPLAGSCTSFWRWCSLEPTPQGYWMSLLHGWGLIFHIFPVRNKYEDLALVRVESFFCDSDEWRQR